MPLQQSVLHSPSKTYYHIRLSSPFPLPGCKSFMPFSSTLSSHSPPALPLTPPAYYPYPLQTDPLLHSCSLTVDLTQNPFQHVTDQSIQDPDTPHWFVDGSSQKSPPFAAGYAIIHGDLCHNYVTQTIEASPLPPHTTSQQAELIALTRALTLAKNLRVNIHTDSKYVG